MPAKKITKFRTKNSSTAFWSGFARQTIDFQNALGELIDNALSARLPKPVGKGHIDAVIEITLQERADQSIRVQVADAGTGVSWSELVGEENIFNLGYQPKSPGAMNEHGFGLKNALALLTSGFSQKFVFLTRAAGGGGAVVGVEGPIQEEMEAKTFAETTWSRDLAVLHDATSGVKVIADVNRDYFQTVYRRGQQFEVLVRRLAEHLGVMYSEFITNGTELHIRYRSKGANTWTQREIPAIQTPFLETDSATVEETTITVELDGTEYNARYRQGRLDVSVKKDTGSLDWPYPLMIHFQGSNARCGLSYFVRGRVLKTGVFREVWPEHAGDVSFNKLSG